MKSLTYTLLCIQLGEPRYLRERMYAVLTRFGLTHMVSDYYPGTVVFRCSPDRIASEDRASIGYVLYEAMTESYDAALKECSTNPY